MTNFYDGPIIPDGEEVPQFVPTAEQEAAMAAYAAEHFAGKTVEEVYWGPRAPATDCGAWDYFQSVLTEPMTVTHALTISQLVFNKSRGKTLEVNMRANATRQVTPGSPSRIFTHWVMTLFPTRALAILKEHYAAEEDGTPKPGLTSDERAYLFKKMADYDAKATEEAMRSLEGRAVGLKLEAKAAEEPMYALIENGVVVDLLPASRCDPEAFMVLDLRPVVSNADDADRDAKLVADDFTLTIEAERVVKTHALIDMTAAAKDAIQEKKP